MTSDQLRLKYPRFFYRSYQYQVTEEGLELEFSFETQPGLSFQPKMVILDVAPDLVKKIPKITLDAWVFHIGLVEMLSYWKATSSPEIIIEAGYLTKAQLKWWKNLLLKGMGEFFYVNTIDFTGEDFVNLSCNVASGQRSDLDATSVAFEHPATEDFNKKMSVLIPVGGGKDSIVSIEVLKQFSRAQTGGLEVPLSLFLLNPTPAAQDVARQSSIEKVIFVKRTLDPQLKLLNQQGFLNGHTPFSALVAFITSFVARLYDFDLIAVSNEHSSNEANVEYLGHSINHQYTKSYEFETSFQTYVQTYLNGELSTIMGVYFSLMRPLYELQIAQLLGSMPEYFPIFRSCNRGRDTNAWCGDCPKCLFTFVALYISLGAIKVEEIFGQNLFENPELLPLALDLFGVTERKPFECVGTHEENKVAFYLSLKKIQQAGQPVPILLQKIDDQVLSFESDLDHRSEQLLSSWNTHHALPLKLELFLKDLVHDA